jgi:hypothetical protein
MQGLMTRLGTEHQLTKAYSKEQNGIVERVNREVISHLKAIIFDRRVQAKWSKYLPIVQRYINTSVHSSTGCTPAEIVFPNGAQIDRELLVEGGEVALATYIRELQDAQGRIIDIAERNLRQKDQAHIESQEGTEPEFEEGSYVLVEHRHNSLRCGPKSKLLPFKAGPYQVIHKGAKSMYTLRDLITMKPKDFHVSKMTTFRYDERTLQPIHVATTDSFDEFVVERVLEMRGRPQGPKRDIAFKVRWAGYTEDDDTWVSCIGRIVTRRQQCNDSYTTTPVASYEDSACPTSTPTPLKNTMSSTATRTASPTRSLSHRANASSPPTPNARRPSKPPHFFLFFNAKRSTARSSFLFFYRSFYTFFQPTWLVFS